MTAKFCPSILILTLLIAFSVTTNAEIDAKHVDSSPQEIDPLERMREYREKDEWDNMLMYADERMKNYPHELEMIQEELVNAYAEQYRLYDLIDYFQAQLKSVPMAVTPYKVLAQTFLRNKELDKATEMYQKVAILAPDDRSVQYNLGEIYQERGVDDKAIVAYRKAIQLQPTETHAYAQLANIYARVGKIEEISQLVVALKPHVHGLVGYACRR